jgi:hypothetical protein
LCLRGVNDGDGEVRSWYSVWVRWV